MFKIIMMSCDKYKCLTPAFKACMDKYFPNHPQIEYVYGEDCWTKRLREKLESITEDFVLVLLDDMLIREPVKEDFIKDAIKTISEDEKVAVINFEKNYREANSYSKNWLEQKQGQVYLHSCQPSLWRRVALIDNLTKNETAWEWETTSVKNNWKYLINKDVDIINVGRTNSFDWGIVRGNMTLEFKEFLINENIYSDEIKEVFE